MKFIVLTQKELANTNGGGLVGLFIGAVLLGYKVEAMKEGNKWYEVPPIPGITD